MATRKRAGRDHGPVSRVIAYLNCEVTFDGVCHEGFVRDLSLNGAFLHANFVPPLGGAVLIKLAAPCLKNALVLKSKVVRTEVTWTERSRVNAFAIRFVHSSPELVELINKLAANSASKDQASLGTVSRSLPNARKEGMTGHGACRID